MTTTKSALTKNLPIIIFWGAIWGIFEATAGYLLHLIPWPIGSIIWFPAAYFFMDRVYKSSISKSAVIMTALLSAAIKLINLLTPMRADYVINPAVSIVLEALALALVIYFSGSQYRRNQFWDIGLRVVAVNTLWRLFYTLYLGFLAPQWMLDASVLAAPGSYLTFILTQNILSALVCTLVVWLFGKTTAARPSIPWPHQRKALTYSALGIALVFSAALQFFL